MRVTWVLTVAVLAGQARRADVFGPKMAVFTWIVAAVLLLSYLFVPIVALMVWIVVCVIGARRAPAAHTVSQPDQRAAALTSER
jgi:hypothetical protein